MRESLKSIWFWFYVVAITVASVTFFTFLHHSIEDRAWGDYFFAIVMYPAAMYGIGALFGSLVQTADYQGEAKLFHLTCFVVVNLVQAVWILGFAPMNLVWFPFALAGWSYGLFRHLQSDRNPDWNQKAEQVVPPKSDRAGG